MRWLSNAGQRILQTGRREGDERGASSVIVAVLMVVLLGFAALAVDVGAIYAEKALRARELQGRSMAAALSADYRRLEMATNLTALLSPRLLGANSINPSQLDGTDQ